MAATLITERPLKFDWDLGKIGSWQKLVRRTAWMSRWQGKRPPDDIDGRDRIVMQHVDANGEFTGEISEHQVRSLRGEEVRAAELKLIRMLQRENFPDAFYALSNDRQLQKKAKLRQLQPVWDPRDELIRVQGRMELAIREAKANPPVLLPANHPVMDLLIRDENIRHSHAGVKTTHSSLRERFWIVRGRQQVKRVLNKCVTCNKLQSRPFDQLPAPLPIERIRRARPFEQCGVDFAGPIYYKPYKYELPTVVDPKSKEAPAQATPGTPPTEGETTPAVIAAATSKKAKKKKEAPPAEGPPADPEESGTQKAYICLFTCAYTRAVYLEPVRDLSAPTFILALRRFFNATGGCQKMISDNAQTFACVSRHLRVLRADPKVCDALAMRGVEWQFSAALAPWWGGFWERMVRTVKDLFRKANGKAVLNYDQFHTALTDVQAVINSRPLVYVGEDDDEQHPLTPFNLMYGHPSPGGLQGPPPSPADYISSKALTNMDKARRKFVNEYTT